MNSRYGKSPPLHRVMVRPRDGSEGWTVRFRTPDLDEANDLADKLNAKDAVHEYVVKEATDGQSKA